MANTPAFKFAGNNQARKRQAIKNREAALDYAMRHPQASMTQIAESVGITLGTLQRYKTQDPDWAAKFMTLRAKQGNVPKFQLEQSKHVQFEKIDDDFDHRDFVQWRKRFMGYDTPWFQLRTVMAYRNAKPGDIVMTLMPPEHGKTTLTEDDLTHTICLDPVNTRITCLSEGQGMARKMSRRLMKRLGADSPHADIVIEYGPFEPQTGEGGHRQEWGVDAWTVYASKASDERDYTFATGGWRSAIAGTRATRLHIDDIQSVRSLNSTEDIWTTFRQDMLSRPGETGITTGNGTRVGPRDFYGRLDDEFRGEDFYTKIEFPAIVMNQATGEPEPLWPYDPETRTGYTLEMLERLRKKVGEDAWWRNYMQKPRSNELDVFSEDGIDRCLNRFRSISHTRDTIPDIENRECWIGLDPSIGGLNAISAVHPARDRLYVLDIQEDRDLPRNSAIAGAVERLIQQMQSRGWRVTMLVIESMAFQKGLINDEAFIKLKDKYGLRIESHMTGYNKYDENIGVPSMASSVENGQIDLPYQDEKDRFMSDGLTAQMRAWKPTVDRTTGRLKFKRGNQLRQDQLMALWFVWIWWADTVSGAGLIPDNDDSFNMGGLPFGMTQSGLLVPNR